jgi:hypothetical protein
MTRLSISIWVQVSENLPASSTCLLYPIKNLLALVSVFLNTLINALLLGYHFNRIKYPSYTLMWGISHLPRKVLYFSSIFSFYFFSFKNFHFIICPKPKTLQSSYLPGYLYFKTPGTRFLSWVRAAFTTYEKPKHPPAWGCYR